MKTLLAVMLVLAASIQAHAQGIAYFSYGAGIDVGDGLPRTEFLMDLDGNGATDFRFVGGNPFAGIGFALEAQSQNKLLGYPTSSNPLTTTHRALRLVSGDLISSASPVAGASWFGKKPNPANGQVGLYLLSCLNAGECAGDFAPTALSQSEGYVGIQFLAADGLHYGWIRVRGGVYNDGRILDYAYNAVPGQSISAGAVPEPSTWALLGVGSLALWKLRRPR